MPSKLLSRMYVMAAALVLIVGATMTTITPSARADTLGCSPYQQNVLGNLKQAGTLCLPAGETEADVLQIFVPGSTYTRDYWNPPGFSGRYDYTGLMREFGYATLAIDQIGVGASSHPLGATVTTHLNAQALHEVVQAAKSGRIGGNPFSKVILVGHSLGTSVALIEAATYQDVDAIIATGLTHGLGAVGLAKLGLSVQPANLHPRLRPAVGLDVTYLTTVPGTRGGLFHARDNVDPAIVEYDERTRDTVTAGQVATVADFAPLTPAVRVPVFLAVGSADQYSCRGAGGLALTACASSAALEQFSKPLFPAADLTAYVLPGAGHDMSLALNSDQFSRASRDWITSTIPA